MKINKLVVLVIIFIVTFFTCRYVIDFFISKYDKTKIDLLNEVIDFGKVNMNSLTDSYIIYKNIGKNDLKVYDVRSTCGCTISKWAKNKLPPNKTDTIFIQYSADEKGYFSKVLYVFSNAKSSPNAMYIKGIVE